MDRARRIAARVFRSPFDATRHALYAKVEYSRNARRMDSVVGDAAMLGPQPPTLGSFADDA